MPEKEPRSENDVITFRRRPGHKFIFLSPPNGKVVDAGKSEACEKEVEAGTVKSEPSQGQSSIIGAK